MATKRVGAFVVRGIVVAGLAAGVAGCEKSMETVVAENRAPVEKVFGQIAALDSAVLALPPVAEDKFDTGGATIILDGDEGEQENALYILAANVGAPLDADDEGNGALHASTVAGCAEALRGEFSGVAGGAELYLQDCARAEYLFVLRTHHENFASISGDSSFDPGVFIGDVVLFRLSDGAHLGGFQVQAENSDVVNVEVDSSGTPIDPTSRLNDDLETMVFSAINTGLRTHLPGAIPES